jgi:hypothetical protein
MKHCQFVIVKENTAMFGVTVFENVVFSGCELSNLTFLMTRQQYRGVLQMVPNLGRDVLVINEEDPRLVQN